MNGTGGPAGGLLENAWGLPPAALAALSVAVALATAWLLRPAKARAPPRLPSLPVVGGAYRFVVQKPLGLFGEGYRRCGQVFTIPMFHKTVALLVGPEVTAQFFKGTDLQMSQKEVYQFNVPTFGRGVVFDVDHTVRREQFRWFADALKPNRLRTYVDKMLDEAEDFFGKWGDEGELDLNKELATLLIMTASRCLLGKEVRETMFERVSSLFHDLDMGMQPISVLFPHLPIEAHRKRDAARKEMSKVFAEVIEKRRAAVAAGGEKEVDILQAFIDAKYSNVNGGRRSTDEEIVGMLIAGLFAGQHTSSVTSSWTSLYLHSKENRDRCLPPVLDEQLRLMAEHGDRLDYDIISKMDHLHRAMKEALRLHPPLIMLMRYAHEDFHVKTRDGKEYTIPKGTICGTSPTFTHRLEYIYKNPDMYDPDRFGPGREEDKYMPFSFIGFGGGRHQCMGENFAFMQVKCIVSVLLRNFDIELISPLPEADYDAMVIAPKGDCIVRYKRRKLAAKAEQ